MNTSVFFSDILATAIVIPGILMCIIPLRSKLRIAPSQFLLWYIPLVSVLCIFSAYIECRTGVFGNSLAFFILLALLCGSSFAALNLPPLKTLYIISLSLTVMSFGGIISYIVDGYFYPGTSPLNGNLGIAVQWIFSIIMMVLVITVFSGKILWIFDNLHLKRIWRLAWLTPAIISLVNVMMVPKNYANIHVGRVYSVMILIIAVNFLVFIISQFMFFTIARSTVEHYEDLNAIQLLNIQASQYEALRDYIEYTGRIRHDFKHTIRTLSAYAAQKDYDALCSYITQYNNEIQADSRRYFFCEHSSTNAVLSYYALIADKHNIRTDWKTDIPANIAIDDTVLSIVFGNLIENAIEACCKIPESERYIILNADTRTEGCLYITMSNSFNGIVHKMGSDFISSKKAGQNSSPSGIGLKSIEKSASNHNGSSRFYYKDKVFYSDVMLQYNDSTSA